MRTLLRKNYRAGYLILFWALSGPLWSAPHVVVLTTDFVMEGKLRMLQDSAAQSNLLLEYHWAGHADADRVAAGITEDTLLLVDAPRGNDMAGVRQAFGEVIDSHAGPSLTIVGGTSRAIRIDRDSANSLAEYYVNGTRPNYEGFFRYWAIHVLGSETGDVPAPVKFPAQGIYHPRMPQLVAESSDEYLAWYQEAVDPSFDRRKGTVGIIMSQGQFASDQTVFLDRMIADIESRGMLPWVFYFNGDDPNGMTAMVSSGDAIHVDVLINTTHLRGVTERPAELDTLGVPMLQSFVYRDGSVAEWRAGTDGIPMRALPAFLAIPEQMGAFDAVVTAAMENGEPLIIDEQLALLLDRAAGLVNIRHTPPAEKRLALMYWSYPPGERGVSASNLNVPRSLESLLPALAQAGYQVGTPGAELLERELPMLLDPWQGRAEVVAWAEQSPEQWHALPVEEYRAWFGQLPEPVRARISSVWGEPHEDAMVTERDGQPVFVIPRLQFGNLIMLPQPARVPGNSTLASYHDGSVPVSHSYLAAYLFVRQTYGADALIHFGTHGSQEFLAGKERGLSVHDDAWLALGGLPVIYPYITDNIGEALQARRRGQAVTISHQTPPFAPAGLHGELMVVHDLIHEWQMLDEGPVRRATEHAIIAAVGEGTLFRDLGWEHQQIESDFPAFEHDLHLYLHELALDAQPLGLHVFGSAPEPGHQVSTIMQMLGERLYDALPLEERDELFIDDFNHLSASEPYQFLGKYLLEGKDPALEPDPLLRELAEQSLSWQALMQGHNETASLLKALEGKYIRTSVGGDPIRTPDTLPTGRNLFGFDPERLPVERAWQVGQTLAEDLIAMHLERHGSYPESLAVSLWSSEALRHQGVLEAQMIHLLGLEPQWDRGGRLSGFRIVPASELGRPRVDVVASITGIYRDQFPHFIAHLAAAIEQLAQLDEEDLNPIAKRAALLANTLTTKGVDEHRARTLAAIRIFSSDSGSYGTGVPDNVFDTEGWEDETEIAEAYLATMQYGYGADSDSWGIRLEELNLYAENLRGVQGAVLGRSSNLHGLLSTDHPFEYLGGIALAVRALSGRSPDLYVANLRQSGKERNVDAARFLAGELRSRYHHPGWISAMQNEGYAGTLELLSVVNNFFGWQVTDPNMVRDDQWESFYDIYVRDSLDLGINEWFEENNAQAQMRIVERMLEAVRREYWSPDEAILQDLVARHQELSEQGAGGRLGEFIEGLSAGFGLDAPSLVGSTVSGQRLTQVETQSQVSATGSQVPLLVLLICLIALAGAIRQWALGLGNSSFGRQV
jgi:cobaltochelatase CobN